MRVLVGGAVAVSVACSALWLAVASATPRHYPGGPYQIYIFDTSAQQSIYAVAVGQRATGAIVENCVGRLMDDAHGTVTSLRARIADRDERLNLVWIEGEGSSVDIGTCREHSETQDYHGDADSLVVVRDASAAQARDIIHEIPISRADQAAMEGALGLNRRARVRR